jgi:molybdopterin synthase sulfur carrier subunit
MATIKIPPVLRGSVGGEKEVQADGRNVGDVLRSLASQHPETESQLFSEDGEHVRVLEGLDTSVSEGDTVVILPAMAGGCR